MVNINEWAIIVLCVQIVAFLVVRKIHGIGDIRGGSISGWLASLVGLSSLVVSEAVSVNLVYVFIYFFIAIIGILVTFVGINNPSVYKIKYLHNIIEYYPKAGIAMGAVFIVLTQVLKP